MQTKKLLTVDEAANQLGLKSTTIRRRILEKTITTVKIGRAVRIPVEAVERIIAAGWRESVAK
ncbi:MAG: excisionase family DNA-binding protein [Nitrospirae bacterium]|nr:excisionase family DNA-binding protein [Nitrospirota bacterium]